MGRHGEQFEPGAASRTAGRPGPDPGLTTMAFPVLGRLELDELLEQLVDRAQEVLSTQDRLRGLLAATQLVSADLSLPVVLRRIVESACDLVGARYGALGVLDEDGHLAQFLTVGVDDAQAERMGRLPHGEGILGLLVQQPRPLRLDELGDHPASVGFPPDHPAMHTFLGVPVRVRGTAFGNLYLTEKAGDRPFTREDEELLTALASAAGVAIENARLYAAAELRQRWLTAGGEAVRGMLAGDPDPLGLVALHARTAAEADLAAVLVPAHELHGLFRVAAADGPAAGDLLGQALPQGSWPTTTTVADQEVAVDGPSTGRRWGGVPLPAGPALVARMPVVDHGVNGVVVVARPVGAPAFGVDEQQLLVGYAQHVRLALDLSRASAFQRDLQVLDDRDRIARDMHDQVVQRLFATGLGMASLTATCPDAATRTRLAALTDQVDVTIRTLRQAIYELQRPEEGLDLRAAVRALVADLTAVLGFSPDVSVVGPLGSGTDPQLAQDALAVLEEALTNVAHHARAHSARVEVELRADEVLAITVTDDGVGLRDTAPRSGLAAVHARAERWGGVCELTSPLPDDAAGTRLRWTAPSARRLGPTAAAEAGGAPPSR